MYRKLTAALLLTLGLMLSSCGVHGDSNKPQPPPRAVSAFLLER